MPRYYFDWVENGDCIRDEIGMDLPGLPAAKMEAARSLGEVAKEALPGSERHHLAIVVRDERERYVLKTSIFFKVVEWSEPA
jgi:hypothetical protein